MQEKPKRSSRKANHWSRGERGSPNRNEGTVIGGDKTIRESVQLVENRRECRGCVRYRTDKGRVKSLDSESFSLSIRRFNDAIGKKDDPVARSERNFHFGIFRISRRDS